MDKETRNKIQTATQQARSLLEREFSEQLEGVFDIRMDGSINDAPGEHLDQSQRIVRKRLISAVMHFRSIHSQGASAAESFLRESAFTTLNRFVALKMLESRGIVQECIKKGDQSSGFREFIGLAPGLVQLTDHGYRNYIESIFDEIGQEVRVLFDRRDPACLLWPRRNALQSLLTILNASDLTEIWTSDETVGWVYQYFNSEDERRQMRSESATPRNTRELAVRNQFFTPRYVVKFLGDNTLGRIWFEMNRGATQLADLEYITVRPNEFFLSEGELPPENQCNTIDEKKSQEQLLKEPFYVPYRAKKDPRDIRIIDPACGSGHFLLYIFDLLEIIYIEAWSDESAPSSEVTEQALKEDYPDMETLKRDIPGLILRYNLFGVDIDSRCSQIAALALWMRAQRASIDSGVSRDLRPPIKKVNIVNAEPMPGNSEFRREFIDKLDSEQGNLVGKVFEFMELAGQAGSLLQIEKYISDSVKSTPKPGLVIKERKEERWEKAERDLCIALENYGKKGAIGDNFQRQLFAEDSSRGFGFIDLCLKRYDVVLMNPPFGDRPKDCEALFQAEYPATSGDLFAMFFQRALELIVSGGKVGVISNRTWLGLPTFKALRTEILGKQGVVDVGADLGSFVLEAQVETAAVVLGNGTSIDSLSPWVRLLKTKAKENTLKRAVSKLKIGEKSDYLYLTPHERFSKLPTSVFGYWMSQSLANRYQPENSIGNLAATIKQGTATADDFRFLRLAWEVNPDDVGLGQSWTHFAKGGEFSPYYDDIHLLINWRSHGEEIIAWGKGRPQNSQYFGKQGITWPRRTTSPFSPRLFPDGCAFGDKGPCAFPNDGISTFGLLGVLTSRPSRLLMSVRLGAGDDAVSYTHLRCRRRG